MQLSPISLPFSGPLAGQARFSTQVPDLLDKSSQAEPAELREAFDDFVGQTFYGQMLGAMRKTVGKSAYFDGGRAEEIFREQLDQVLAEKMSDASADQFTGSMFDLFSLERR
jgi:hypothetical protein